MQKLAVIPYMAGFLALVLTLSAGAATTQAQTATDRLGQCLKSKSTGADRLALIKWTAIAISANPALREIIAVPQEEIDRSDKEIAAIFTDLLVTKCPAEARAVLSSENKSKAMEVAFEELGAMAAQEVYSGKEIQERMSGFLRYINKNDLKALDIH